MSALGRILLVEDDPYDAELTLTALEESDLTNQVVVTRDGAEALDYLYRRAEFVSRSNGSPAVMLLDLKLPKVDGLEVLQQIKSDQKLKMIPVVVLTSGTLGEEVAIETLKMGATDYVLKTRLSRLVPAVQRALREAEAEEALRASEERWRMLFENSSAGIALMAPDGRYLATNLALQKMFGYTEEELQGLTALELTHEEDRSATEAILAESTEGKRRNYRIEKRYRRKAGDLIWTDVSSTLVPATGSRPAFLATVIVDITERKRAEEALQKAQAELAHVTRVTTLGELTASIAHEINQPLGALANNASACLRWLRAQNLEEARRSAELVIADGHRAGEIIGRIRALAKKAPPQKDWLDLNHAISEAIALARSEVQKNRVSLQTQLSNDLPLILGDRIQLQQVILNLVINAIEAMSGVSEGPRELWVSSEKVTEIPGESEQDPPEDKALAEAKWTHVLVAVRDSGPGLDTNGIGRLFDAFYTTKSQGLGMGLAISRSIVEGHGGRLWATANVSKGALFQFAVPIRDE